MAFTALGASAWGIPAFFVGVGYLVKAGFEAFTNYAERYVEQELGSRKETLRGLERRRRKAARSVWYNRRYYSLQRKAMSELVGIDKEITKRKEEMNAK